MRRDIIFAYQGEGFSHRLNGATQQKAICELHRRSAFLLFAGVEYSPADKVEQWRAFAHFLFGSRRDDAKLARCRNIRPAECRSGNENLIRPGMRGCRRADDANAMCTQCDMDSLWRQRVPDTRLAEDGVVEREVVRKHGKDDVASFTGVCDGFCDHSACVRQLCGFSRHRVVSSQFLVAGENSTSDALAHSAKPDEANFHTILQPMIRGANGLFNATASRHQ